MTDKKDECKICSNADNEYCFACDNGNQFKPNILPTQVYKLALMYAYDMIHYGVDITKKWDTVVRQHEALNSAYLRGMHDERNRHLGRETR